MKRISWSSKRWNRSSLKTIFSSFATRQRSASVNSYGRYLIESNQKFVVYSKKRFTSTLPIHGTVQRGIEIEEWRAIGRIRSSKRKQERKDCSIGSWERELTGLPWLNRAYSLRASDESQSIHYSSQMLPIQPKWWLNAQHSIIEHCTSRMTAVHSRSRRLALRRSLSCSNLILSSLVSCSGIFNCALSCSNLRFLFNNRLPMVMNWGLFSKTWNKSSIADRGALLVVVDVWAGACGNWRRELIGVCSSWKSMAWSSKRMTCSSVSS